jgi:hypothetical protein
MAVSLQERVEIRTLPHHRATSAPAPAGWLHFSLPVRSVQTEDGLEPAVVGGFGGGEKGARFVSHARPVRVAHGD